MEGKGGSFGFDAQSEKYTDLVKAGIVDPTKVVRTALQDAASIASLLITTEAMVAEKPEDKPAARQCHLTWRHGRHGRHDVTALYLNSRRAEDVTVNVIRLSLVSGKKDEKSYESNTYESVFTQLAGSIRITFWVENQAKRLTVGDMITITGPHETVRVICSGGQDILFR